MQCEQVTWSVDLYSEFQFLVQLLHFATGKQTSVHNFLPAKKAIAKKLRKTQFLFCVTLFAKHVLKQQCRAGEHKVCTSHKTTSETGNPSCEYDSAGIMLKINTENNYLKAFQNAREPHCITVQDMSNWEFCVCIYINIFLPNIKELKKRYKQQLWLPGSAQGFFLLKGFFFFPLLPKCFLTGAHLIFMFLFFFLCILVGSFPHRINCLEATVVVISCNINKIELNYQ